MCNILQIELRNLAIASERKEISKKAYEDTKVEINKMRNYHLSQKNVYSVE